jgi:hypothetical protein
VEVAEKFQNYDNAQVAMLGGNTKWEMMLILTCNTKSKPKQSKIID